MAVIMYVGSGSDDIMTGTGGVRKMGSAYDNPFGQLELSYFC
jgi:hypothetical protein